MTAAVADEQRAALRPASPYKGLAAFEDTALDELLFFGRERTRAVLVANLVAARLTVLFGPSGVGKSSVLRAAVARDLRAQPERPLVAVVDTWTGQPAVAIAEGVAAAAGIPPGPLADTVELAAASRGDVYLILDQVEAYFVQHGADRALGDAIAELLRQHDVPVHVLLSIREDALSRLDVFKAQIPDLLANRLRLEPLDRDGGRRAILGPIEQFDTLVPEEEALAIEPELVEAVLDGVTAGALAQTGRARGVDRAAMPAARIETPYLQLVMQRLWDVERRAGSRVLRLSTLEKLGGPAHVVENHLERALQALTLRQKQLAAGIFNHLVTPSGMKVSHRAADLARYAETTEAELQPLLATLDRERILRSVPAEGGGRSHEIFHDVLAEAVLGWRGRFEADQAVECERAAARRRHRRLAAVAVVALAGLAAMVAVALLAVSSAREARARGLAYNALALVRSEPEQSLDLAVRATQTDGSLGLAESTLRDALLATRALHVLPAGGAVNEAEPSPDGRLVATAGAGGARVFRLADGALLATLSTGGPANTVAFSPTGPLLATAGDDGRTLLWDTRTLRLQRALKQPGRVTGAGFSPDGRLVETTGSDHAARLWQTATGRLLLELRHPLAVLGAGFSPDGTRLVTFTNDPFARVWDTRTGKLLYSLAHRGAVTSALFSPAGDMIATTSRDGSARLWRAADGKLVHDLSGSANAPAVAFDLLSAAFSPDGTALVAVGTDGNGRVWSTESGELEAVLAGHLTATRSAAFSPDGGLIVTAGTDGSARIWSYPDGNEQADLLGHRDAVVQATFSPSGATVLTASADGTARIWDAGIDRPLALLGRHDGPATGVAFSPDGATLVSSGADGVRVWRLEPRALVRRLAAGTPIEDVAFSRDGRLLVGAGADGSARVWDLSHGGTLVGRVDVSGGLRAAALSPDGTIVATAGPGRNVRLTPLRGGSALVLRHPAAVNDVAFSPSGRLVATASDDGRARLWDASSGSLVRALVAHTHAVESIAFSADGRLLVTASADHDVRIWNAASGAMVRLLHGHAAIVSDAAFSADGRWVVSAGPAKAGVWAVAASDLPANRLFFVTGHSGALAAAAFAPHGWLLATAAADGSIRTYDCELCGNTQELLGLARTRLAQLRAAASPASR